MKFCNIVLLLVVAIVECGCIEQETACTANVETDGAPSTEKPIQIEPPSTDNVSCSVHSDCQSDECVPTILHIAGSVGVCWDVQFEGCALVDFEQWVIADMCGMRELVVCQLQSTPEMQAQCVPPDGGSAPWIANLLCCDPSFL